MYLSNYRAEHLIVKNGGGMVIPDAPGPANIISSYSGIAELIFNNVSIVNSAGWGMYLDITSKTPDFGNPEAKIIFSGNASGEHTYY